MESTNSEEKQSSTSQKVDCPIQSSYSLESIISGINYDDPDTDKQQASLKIDVPGDGSCLFWAVTLAYLIPVKDNDDLFQLRYNNLFGNNETEVKKVGYVRTCIQNFNPLSDSVLHNDNLSYLVRNTFRNRVVDFIESNLDGFECFSEIADEQYRFNMRNPDIWSGDAEIQAISLILNCKINVDGQIFPLISSSKRWKYDSERINLNLFHVNRGTGDTQSANHFNYGLEKNLIEEFCKKRIDTNLKISKMYPGERSMQGDDSIDALRDFDETLNFIQLI